MSAAPPPFPNETPTAPQLSVEEYLNQPVRNCGKLVAGTEGMTIGQVEDDVLSGGRFVIFSWNFSMVILSFKRSSPLTYLRAGQWAGPKALMWSLPSFFLGPWGFPWGMIFTVMSLFTNSMGGKDVTKEVLTALIGSQRAEGILARQPKRSPGDPVLWLLRVICLSIPVGIIYLISSIWDASSSAHVR